MASITRRIRREQARNYIDSAKRLTFRARRARGWNRAGMRNAAQLDGAVTRRWPA